MQQRYQSTGCCGDCCPPRQRTYFVMYFFLTAHIINILLMALDSEIVDEPNPNTKMHKFTSIVLIALHCVHLPFTLLGIYGTHTSNPDLILLWLIISALCWMIFLGMVMISAVIATQVKNTYGYIRLVVFIFYQAIWCALLISTWCYWRALNEIQMLPEYLRRIEHERKGGPSAVHPREFGPRTLRRQASNIDEDYNIVYKYTQNRNNIVF